MKSTVTPNPTRVMEQSMSFDNEKTLGISDEVIGHITTVLSGFYANSEYAVARETISNGVDACAELGVDPRIDIALSGSLADSHFVEFRDYGVGMSPDVFANYFAEYGKSTKRDTNDQTGFFGLGAKSFYAISSHDVMVTTENNGVKTLGIFGKDDQNKGTVKFKSLGKTDSTGTAVRVPLRNRHSRDEMLKAIRKAAYALPPNTVFVNGEAMMSYEDNKLFTFPDGLGYVVSQTDRTFDSPVQALLGGIVYPLNNFDGLIHSNYFRNNATIILTFDLQDGLMPLSQRDSLESTPHNTRILEKRIEQIQEVLPSTLQSLLDDMTRFEATKLVHGRKGQEWSTWWRILMNQEIPAAGFTWHGDPLKAHIDFEDDENLYVFHKRFGARGQRITKMAVEAVEKSLVFNDVSIEDLRKRNIAKYYNHCAQQGAVNIVLLKDNEPVTKDWVTFGGDDSDVEVVERDEILEFATSTRQGGTSRTDYTIQYEVINIDNDGKWTCEVKTPREISEIDKPFGFMRGWNSDIWGSMAHNPYFREWAAGKSFVTPRNSQKEELILKRVKNAEDWTDQYEEFLLKKIKDAYSVKNMKTRVKVSFSQLRNRYWHHGVLDSFIKYASENYSGAFTEHVKKWYQQTTTEADKAVVNELVQLARYVPHPLISAYSEKVEAIKEENKISAKYPLLSGSFEESEVIFEHLLEYVKMVDEQVKEKTNG